MNMASTFIQNPTAAHLSDYLDFVHEFQANADLSEESFYPRFIRLLEILFEHQPDLKVVSGFKKRVHVDEGQALIKPDISVLYKNLPILHIEAKHPGTDIESELKPTTGSRLHSQVYRYRNGETYSAQGRFPVLITDFLTIYAVDPDSPNTLDEQHQIKIRCNLEDLSGRIQGINYPGTEFGTFLEIICKNIAISIDKASEVIDPLALIAKELRAAVIEILLEKSEDIHAASMLKYLDRLKEDFQMSLFRNEDQDINDIFSDIFAQTVVYGCFSAWISHCKQGNSPGSFRIRNCSQYLPFGTFIYEMFTQLESMLTPSIYTDIILRIEDLLTITNLDAITTHTESFLTTFYSDFLAKYDPDTQKKRGVVYTPHEIVDCILRGIDFCLQKHFNCPSGIIQDTLPTADEDGEAHAGKEAPIKILDPAAGTMAFPCGLLILAKRKFEALYNNNPLLADLHFKRWVKEVFFPNTYSFEILMAPLILGQLRLLMTLENFGMQYDSNWPKLQSLLANTLMDPEYSLDRYMFNNPTIREVYEDALKVRHNEQIYIIMGNPPYSLSSQNNSPWIRNLIEDYKENLDEGNTKILSDDYVKFLRFAEWKIRKVGFGIVGFITNNNYLDGRVFKVMRGHLMETFDHIYVINLHGNARKGESGNPFNIMVGVSIVLLVRTKNRRGKDCQIHYCDVPYDSVEEKFDFIAQPITDDLFEDLPPTHQNYLLKVKMQGRAEWESFPSITKFFAKGVSSGVMVGRDQLLVNADPLVLEKNLEMFFDRQFDQLEALGINVSPTKSWKRDERMDKTNLKRALTKIQRFSYRSFDRRYLVYDTDLVEGHRKTKVGQVSRMNPAITVTKSSRKSNFCTAFISNVLFEKCHMAVTDTSYGFMLRYKGDNNILIPKKKPYPMTPVRLFYYIYGILWSPTYRERYNEFLLKEYPRIPIAATEQNFMEISTLGEKIANAHMLNRDCLDIEPFQLHGENLKIKDVTYVPAEERVYFQDPSQENATYIENISEDMWNFQIGTILQIEQWLTARKYSDTFEKHTLQRPLNENELSEILSICAAIKKSLVLSGELDNIYKKTEFLT